MFYKSNFMSDIVVYLEENSVLKQNNHKYNIGLDITNAFLENLSEIFNKCHESEVMADLDF